MVRRKKKQQEEKPPIVKAQPEKKVQAPKKDTIPQLEKVGKFFQTRPGGGFFSAEALGKDKGLLDAIRKKGVDAPLTDKEITIRNQRLLAQEREDLKRDQIESALRQPSQQSQAIPAEQVEGQTESAFVGETQVDPETGQEFVINPETGEREVLFSGQASAVTPGDVASVIPAGAGAGLLGAGIRTAGKAAVKKSPTLFTKAGKVKDFFNFAKDPYKGLDRADAILRRERIISKNQKRFKIDRTRAVEVAKNFGDLTSKEAMEALSNPKFAKKGINKALGVGAIGGFIGINHMMTWMAVDNIAQSSVFYTKGLKDALIAGTITRQEAIEELDKTDNWLGIAEGYVHIASSIVPTLWPFRKSLKATLEASRAQFELNNRTINQFQSPTQTQGSQESLDLNEILGSS